MKNQILTPTLVIIILVESIFAVSFGNNGRLSEEAAILPVHQLLADNTTNDQSGSEEDPEEVPPKIIDLNPEVT